MWIQFGESSRLDYEFNHLGKHSRNWYFLGIFPKLVDPPWPSPPWPGVHLGIKMSLLAKKKVGFSRPKTEAIKISHKV